MSDHPRAVFELAAHQDELGSDFTHILSYYEI